MWGSKKLKTHKSAFCVAYVQKKRNTPTFHDFDWSLPEQRFAFFQQYKSFWTPTSDIGYLPKKIALTHRKALFLIKDKKANGKTSCCTKRRRNSCVALQWNGEGGLCLSPTGTTAAQRQRGRPKTQLAQNTHTHTHTSRESEKSGTLLVCSAACYFLLPLRGG